MVDARLLLVPEDARASQPRASGSRITANGSGVREPEVHAVAARQNREQAAATGEIASGPMASWQEFVDAAPEFARRVEALFTAQSTTRWRRCVRMERLGSAERRSRSTPASFVSG